MQSAEAEEGWRLVPSTLSALSETPQSWEKLVEVGRIIEPREEGWTDGLREPEARGELSRSAEQEEFSFVEIEIDLPPACRGGRLELAGQRANLQPGINSIRMALS
ncbi:MAG: hypothetical protein ACLFS1_05695 [Opitutales bacterium]